MKLFPHPILPANGLAEPYAHPLFPDRKAVDAIIDAVRCIPYMSCDHCAVKLQSCMRSTYVCTGDDEKCMHPLGQMGGYQ